MLGFDPRLLAYVDALATYWITPPAVLFFTRTLGPRFERLFRVLLAVLVAYAIVASLVDLWLAQPRAAMGPNTWLVLSTQVVALAAFFGPGVRVDADLRILRWSYVFLLVFVVNENLGGLGWPHVPDIEVFGFLGFLAGLGYVTAEEPPTRPKSSRA